MSELIKSEITKIRNLQKQLNSVDLSDDRAFSYLLLQYVFEVDIADQQDLVTDGNNDGGIDFLYFDEEESKVIICQSKYTGSLSFEEIITELNKMYSTLQNFRIGNTGSYNDRLKKALQNALDRLPDENSFNVEMNLYTTAPVDVSLALKKINNSQHEYSTELVKIYVEEDIEKSINNILEKLDTVQAAKIKIDAPNNYLQYESESSEGIMCNILSTSLIKLYNSYAAHGLFDLNIRKYIRNTLVDTGIKETLDKDRENFWFLNNGIIIACQEYEVDGDTVKIWDFSIVNGGQTTTLISTYKGNNTKEFYIPCKIVATKGDDPVMSFFTKIAEATNSQKPIYPRDLKSNTPEMRKLSKLLGDEKIFLEIKRGIKAPRNTEISIKNDELAQLILSFAFQRPGTARNGKKTIFENSDLYAQIFKVNYFDDANKKGFLIDIINLYERYKALEKKYKQNNALQDTELDVLKNGTQVIFALMGVLYRLVNGDISENDLLNNTTEIKNIPFSYSAFISNYTADDLESKLEVVIRNVIAIVSESYEKAYDNKKATSVSNYFKTDKKYIEDILTSFAKNLRYSVGTDIKNGMDIFKR